MSISALLQIKMNSNFNCIYMAMSSNIYSGFFCEIFSASLFRLGILWDKNRIKIFCSVTPPFSINFRCQIENQVSDYRLLGASNSVLELCQLICPFPFYIYVVYSMYFYPHKIVFGTSWSKAKFKSTCNVWRVTLYCSHIFDTCHLWKCQYYVYWNLSFPLSIL